MLIYKVMPDGERGFVYEPSLVIKHAVGSTPVYKSRTPKQTLKAVYTRQVNRAPATVQEIMQSLQEKGMFGGSSVGISAKVAAAKPKFGSGSSKKLTNLIRQEKPVTARLAAGGK